MTKRRKLSDMTPYERVSQRMKNMTWEEAEDVGIEILARVLALHVYSRKEGREYFDKLMERVCVRADEWAHSDFGRQYLAFAAVGYKIEKRKEG